MCDLLNALRRYTGLRRSKGFHQKMKMMNLQYICIFMYIWWLLVGGVLLWKAYQTCRHARTFQLVSQQSLASINNKNPTILTKRPPVVTTVPLGTQRHHWALVYRGIPSDLRSRPEQSHHALLVTTEKALTFTIYDCILRIRPKRCYLTKVSPLDVELI